MPTESTDIYEDAIVRRMEFSAAPEKVWGALTESGQFGRWFRVDLAGPFTPGATVTGQMTFPGHEGAPFEAKIEAVEPRRRFAYSWVPGPAGAQAHDGRTLVEFTLEPAGSGTRMTLRESGFAALDEHQRFAAMRSNSNGWDEQLRSLTAYLAG